MCESSSHAFRGSLDPRDVTLLSYGLGGLAGGGSVLPLSSNTSGCTCLTFVIKKLIKIMRKGNIIL